MSPIVAFYAGVVGGIILTLMFPPSYFFRDKPKRARTAKETRNAD